MTTVHAGTPAMRTRPFHSLLSPLAVRERIERNEAILIDVREPMEHARQRIDGAWLVPLGRLGSDTIGDTGGRLIILHCQSGRRAGEGAQRLLESCGMQAAQLEGGIEGWKQAGLPVVENRKAPLPIMRQVQMIAGSLVLIGSLLGFFVSAWFFTLSAFVGGGLLLAGATGWCGMAKLLGRMPWNRVDSGCGPNSCGGCAAG